MRARPRYAICLNRGSILLEFSSLKICELIKEFSPKKSLNVYVELIFDSYLNLFFSLQDETFCGTVIQAIGKPKKDTLVQL